MSPTKHEQHLQTTQMEPCLVIVFRRLLVALRAAPRCRQVEAVLPHLERKLRARHGLVATCSSTHARKEDDVRSARQRAYLLPRINYQASTIKQQITHNHATHKSRTSSLGTHHHSAMSPFQGSPWRDPGWSSQSSSTQTHTPE